MNTSQMGDRKQRRIAGVIVLGLVLAIAWFWIEMKDDAAETQARTVEVSVGDVEELVTAQGKLEPKEYVDVGTQVSGQVHRIHALAGDTVSEGDLLAEIDPRLFEARLEGDMARMSALEAQLEEQRAQRQLAIQRHERNLKLIETNAISQETMEVSAAERQVAEGRLAVLQAQIAEARSNLEASRTNLEYTKIYAPMSGTVVEEITREGQTVNANQTAPVIMRLANLDTMTVRAQVAEADVTRLTPGMPVYFTTLGMQDRRWLGTVRQILPTPEVLNEVVLYIVLIDVNNSDRLLMTGMSAQVFFIAGQARDVPTVPVQALGMRVTEDDDDRGRAYEVVVATASGTEARIVHVGVMNRSLAEVRDGLREGDRVVLGEFGGGDEARQRVPRRMTGGMRL
ncbi:MAG: efflux RND transporter periplasmic adaptor subunit [Sphingomonadales bacterium]